jgi:hypothetical protein
VDCTLSGLPLFYASELFLPSLFSVNVSEGTDGADGAEKTLVFSGAMLIRCADLAFSVVTLNENGTEVGVQPHQFESVPNETCGIATVPHSALDLPEDAETVAVWITFVGHHQLRHTEPLPLVTRHSETGTASEDGAISRSSGVSAVAVVLLSLSSLLGVGLVLGSVFVCVVARRTRKRMMHTATLPFQFLETSDTVRLPHSSCLPAADDC